MKKKLLKSFLLAVTLLVGTSAWAQTTTTLMEYGTNDVPWTTARLAEWTAGGNPTFDDNTTPTYVGITGGNGSYATSKTISPDDDVIINLTAVWRGSSSTGRAFSAGNGSYFRFGNIIVAQNDQDKKHGYVFTGLSNMASVTQFTAGSYRVDITSSTWLKIEAEINTATNTLTSFTIKSEDGATTYVTQSNVPLSTPDYTTVAFGYQKAGSVSYANAEQLKSIKITQTTQAVEIAGYTIKFQDGDGNTLKSDITDRTGIVGETVTLISADKADFYTGTAGVKADYHKWTYVSDNASAIANDGSTVVIIRFSEVAKYDYSVTSKADETVLPFAYNGWQFNGETVTVPYPNYQLYSGTLYTKGATDKEYKYSFTLSSDNQAEEITGYADSGIEGVRFYTEGEDIEGASTYSTGGANTRCSRAAVGSSASALTVYEDLPAGIYKITVGFYKASSGSATSTDFTIGATHLHITTASDGVNSVQVTSDDFVVATESDVVWDGTINNLDYVFVRRTGDLPATENIIVSDAGYATYVSNYNLDFSDPALKVKAYTVEVASKGVATPHPINKVPAKTPVLLYAVGGNGEGEAITVSSSAMTAVEGNDLVAGTGVAVATDGGTVGNVAYTNMILNNVGGKIGFYFANGKTVAANRAYLHIASTLAPDASESRMVMVFADDEATAVFDLNDNSEMINNNWYDLQGRRVDGSRLNSGIYIKNGKKVVVK